MKTAQVGHAETKPYKQMIKTLERKHWGETKNQYFFLVFFLFID